MSFSSLGLSAELLASISEQGYQNPTSIQQKTIPAVLQGHDIMASAQTGTGKTAGFTLPLLQRLSTIQKSTSKHAPPIRALILTPTRELAAQIHEKVEIYGKYLPLKSAVVFGGVKINPQISRLRKNVDILIATPGRLLDLVNQQVVKLNSIEILVLDEADRMLDMGFIHDVRKILNLMPKRRQNLLFSATFSNEITVLVNKLLKSPILIEAKRCSMPAELIKQVIYPVDRSRKRELLSFIIGSKNWQQVLVFTRTKRSADRLAKQLQMDGLTSAAIHSNKSQGARIRTLAEFKLGRIRVLVATDIAARGLDIDKLPQVINYELPDTPENYVHRIGRTGRASNVGLAISFVCSEERKLLWSIEKLLKCKLDQEIIPGYEYDLPAIKMPMRQKPRKKVQRHRSKFASRKIAK